MTTITRTLEADLATVTDAVNIGPRTVVALPPSDLDDTITGGGFGAYADGYAGSGAVLAIGDMRIYVGGVLVLRAYDPNIDGTEPVVGAGGYAGGYGGGYA